MVRHCFLFLTPSIQIGAISQEDDWGLSVLPVYEKFTEILAKVRFFLPSFEQFQALAHIFVFLQAWSNKFKDKLNKELDEFEQVCSDRTVIGMSLMVDDWSASGRIHEPRTGVPSSRKACREEGCEETGLKTKYIVLSLSCQCPYLLTSSNSEETSSSRGRLTDP